MKAGTSTDHQCAYVGNHCKTFLFSVVDSTDTENTEPANRSSCEGARKCCASPTKELVIEIAVVKCQHNKANALHLITVLRSF